MAGRKIIKACATAVVCAAVANAHGGAHQKPLQVDANADWATRHMAEEHHIGTFDAASFFQLHDFDDNGFWDRQEILKTYGMESQWEDTAKDIPQTKKDEIAMQIFKLMDTNNNFLVERYEWMKFCEDGGVLPDFGTQGHHWDMEIEYEIHHWEKYHDENTKEEELTHPEDIEHFKKHDELEDEAIRVAALDKLAIVEQNIPLKFRREGS